MITGFTLECPNNKKKAHLYFSIIQINNINNKEYYLGLIDRCSLVNFPCANCPHAKLIGTAINL